MGSQSFNLRRGETIECFVRRDYPYAGALLVARQIAAETVAMLCEAPSGECFAAVAVFSSGYVKYMDESVGPYHAGCYPADMLALLSPLTEPGYAAAWRQRQNGEG